MLFIVIVVKCEPEKSGGKWLLCDGESDEKITAYGSTRKKKERKTHDKMERLHSRYETGLNTNMTGD